MAEDVDSDTDSGRRGSELRVFLFITIFLAPAMSVAIVGGYGFMVWIYQIFMGPPKF